MASEDVGSTLHSFHAEASATVRGVLESICTNFLRLESSACNRGVLTWAFWPLQPPSHSWAHHVAQPEPFLALI